MYCVTWLAELFNVISMRMFHGSICGRFEAGIFGTNLKVEDILYGIEFLLVSAYNSSVSSRPLVLVYRKAGASSVMQA